MGVGPAEFKAALARFPSGVTVVTVHDPEAATVAGGTSEDDPGDHGMTASAFCSVSLSPPLVLICVAKGNTTHALLERLDGFAINILSDAQVTVSNRFAGWWEPGRSKWADLELRRAEVSRAPLIEGALAQIDCKKWSTADGGDHTIFLGEVQGVFLSEEAPADLHPLLYFSGRYRKIGEPT